MRAPRTRHPLLLACFAIGAATLCLAVAACGSGGSSTTGAVAVPQIAGGDAVPARTAPPIELTDQHGKRIDLARLKGRAVLVAFLYTHCEDLCPIVAGKIHTAFAGIPKSQRPLFLAVSVDPAGDTPASAAAFDKRHRTVGEIDWLLGSRAELEKVWKAWKVKPESEANDPEEIEHNAEIFAIDPQGKIRALYPPNFKPAALAAGTETLARL